MQEIKGPNLSADLLDRLVLDSVELERLTERLIRSLDASDLADMPRGRIAVQLMDLLVRLAEAGDGLHRAATDQMKSVAAALASDPVGEPTPLRQRDRRRVTLRGHGPDAGQEAISSRSRRPLSRRHDALG